MAKVDVYIFTVNENSKSFNRLKELFSGELFHVQEVYSKSDKYPSSLKQSCEDSNLEIHKFLWCLEQTECFHPDRGIVYLREDSITNISKQKLEDLVNYINHKNANYDLFYLCRWNDECQKIIDVQYNQYFNLSIGRTYHPGGLQAVYISKHGRNVILGKELMKNGKKFVMGKNSFLAEIEKGNLISYCTVNNVFDYDITQATQNLEFDKTSVCRKMNDKDDDDQSSSNLGYLYFIIVIIIAVLIAFAIAKIGR